MKKLLRAAAAVSAAAMALTFAAPVANEKPEVQLNAIAAVDDCNDDWLHAEGSRLYDMNGNEVWITGLNWFGFNCGERFPHGLWSADVDELLSSVADRGVNLLRLPMATELILDWMEGVDDHELISINPKNEDGYKFNPDFCRPDGECMSSLEIFDVIMAKCKKYGIKIMIDIHSPALHNSGHNYNLWYYDEGAGSYDSMAVTDAGNGIPVTSKMWQDSLVWLADRYKNDDTLIAYDLKNEPHGKCPEGSAGAKWDGSTDENNWAYASTKCALAMLEKNPNALIMIEGVEQYPREGHQWGDPDSRTDPPAYGGWWGGQFRGVRDYPIDLGQYQNKLVYSPHDYGPSVYAQTWFDKDFTTQTLLDDYWYDTWAFINKEEIAPLLIGEWGGFMDGDKNQKWMELLREYMIENHINHTFWCLNPNSGDTGGLLDYSFKTWDEEKYGLFEPSLWQTAESGKYISLDHNVALGKNGVSLNEYYTNYAKTEGSNIDGGTKNPQPKPPVSTVTTKPVTTTTTTAKTTTTTTTAPTTVPTEPDKKADYGDANCDGTVALSDAVCVMQAIGNPDTYGENGTDKNRITAQGAINGDVNDPGSGLTNSDALSIQKYLLKLISKLPE
ncbi:MAG: cellulase family glycosylhydrolase [Ruminococcus sp.]|nr:cellulase family glycosylhydrolase [Ruminococcus sp.]